MERSTTLDSHDHKVWVDLLTNLRDCLVKRDKTVCSMEELVISDMKNDRTGVLHG